MKKSHYSILLLAGCVSVSAWAGSFVVGVESNSNLPMGAVTDNKYTGYGRDLLDAFGSKNGHTFTYQPMPVKRLWDEYLVQKSVDFRFPDNPRWMNDSKKNLAISYSRGVITLTDGLMVLPSQKGKALESIKKISMVRGFSPSSYREQIEAKKIEVSEVNDAAAAIAMVEAGRVDGAYVNVQSTTYLMAEVLKKPGAVVYDDTLPHSATERSLSSILHPEVIKQLDEFLVKEKDTVAKIKAKYKIVE